MGFVRMVFENRAVHSVRKIEDLVKRNSLIKMTDGYSSMNKFFYYFLTFLNGTNINKKIRSSLLLNTK